jgi:predicted RNA binding protein YcfA (HicA-like mRNA interferase family)
MKRRDVVRALRRVGCSVAREGSEHTIWQCSCPEGHTVAVPRHVEVSAGVVRSIQERIACQRKGWLQ